VMTSPSTSVAPTSRRRRRPRGAPHPHTGRRQGAQLGTMTIAGAVLHPAQHHPLVQHSKTFSACRCCRLSPLGGGAALWK